MEFGGEFRAPKRRIGVLTANISDGDLTRKYSRTDVISYEEAPSVLAGRRPRAGRTHRAM